MQTSFVPSLDQGISRNLVNMSIDVQSAQKIRASIAASHAASISSARALNIFRLAADLTHLASIVILGLKISKTRSCAGMILFEPCRYLP